jgi:hypothetical protein
MRRACELPQSLRLSRLRDSSEHFAASEAPPRGIPCLSRLEPHLTLLFSTHLSIVPQVVICEKRRRFADRSVHLRRKCRPTGREGDETWAPVTHTSHQRGQQLALLRMLGREEYSNYGPTADTGGLMQNTPRQSTLTQTCTLCSKAKPPEGGRRSCPVLEISRLRNGRIHGGSDHAWLLSYAPVPLRCAPWRRTMTCTKKEHTSARLR